jgi:multidrug resistance efflux pump
MFIGLLVTTLYVTVVWLVFFRFKWLRFSIGWGVVSALFGVHLLLIFLVGVRFVAPGSYRAVVVQHTVQITPRLPGPTLLTEVLVEDNVPVRKGQPLFRFDSRTYQFQVEQLEAQLAAAKQNVNVLKTNIEVAAQKVIVWQAKLTYALFEQGINDRLAQEQALRENVVDLFRAKVAEAKAEHATAVGDLEIARLKYDSQINGVNTSVAALEAQLGQARYYLEQTTIVAPADGRIINLQARPGMVVGEFRIGSIASLVVDEDRYVLGMYRQENLKYVHGGQPVEVALDLYPGRIVKGTVDSIWWGTGQGQFLPTSELPSFGPQESRMAEGLFAVKIRLDVADQKAFPIGAQGTAAIYTRSDGFAALRRVSIRAYSWGNWLYPLQ